LNGRDGAALDSIEQLAGLPCGDSGRVALAIDDDGDIAMSCAGPSTYIPTVSAGYLHTCQRNPNGTVTCWGYNKTGQTGNPATAGLTTDPAQTALYTLPDISNAVSVSAGYDHSCALLADGTVSCWGSNRSSQLGSPNGRGTAQILGPQPVVGLTDVVAIDAGLMGTCAVRVDGSVWCWGFGIAGPQAAPIFDLTNVRSVSVGEGHACVVNRSGEAMCWGDNSQSQVGVELTDEDSTYQAEPVLVELPGAVTDVRAGARTSCALMADKTVLCWGTNEFGLLGVDGPHLGVGSANWQPVRVAGVGDVLSFDLTTDHACAQVGADKHVLCWGASYAGQSGTLNDAQPTPQVIPDLHVIQVAAGALTSYGQTSAPATWAWGSNFRGQRGNSHNFLAGGDPAVTQVGVG
jgi:alpha-tubulin suppressor-like RCC1 family protein